MDSNGFTEAFAGNPMVGTTLFGVLRHMMEGSGFDVPVVVALVVAVVLVLVGVALVGFAPVVTAAVAVVLVVVVAVGAVHVSACPLCFLSLSELANNASVPDPVFRFVFVNVKANENERVCV